MLIESNSNVLMLNGSTKKAKELQIGDLLFIGGKVKNLSKETVYKEVHMVKEAIVIEGSKFYLNGEVSTIDKARLSTVNAKGTEFIDVETDLGMVVANSLLFLNEDKDVYDVLYNNVIKVNKELKIPLEFLFNQVNKYI